MEWSARAVAVVTAAFGLIASAACDTKDPVACTVDTDCAAGQICRDGFCGAPGSRTSSGDASTSDAAPADPGTSGGTSGTSGTTSSGATCQDVYGICAAPFDCCSGLACTNGVCR